MYYIGIDVHLKKCMATIKGNNRSIIKQMPFENTTEGISDFIRMVNRKYQPAMAVCESTGNYWILSYDMLTAAGIEIKLANPKNTKIIAQAKLKDDKVDSEVLADLLRSDMIAESFVPDDRYRDMRALVRARLDLRRTITSRSNRIHAIVCKYPRKPKISCVKSNLLDDIQMSDTDRQLVSAHQSIINAVQKELKILDSNIAQTSLDDERTRRLMTIPGIGHITAVTILAEVADHKRFASAEKMASYAGLVPSHRNSADVTKGGGITKTGSVWLRNAMVESATTAIRYDERLKKKYENLSARIGKMKAKVAIARIMTEIVWHMLTNETEYRTKNEDLIKRKMQRIRMHSTP